MKKKMLSLFLAFAMVITMAAQRWLRKRAKAERS